jgi:hypothetical protein
MDTVLSAGQVAPKEAAEAITLKHGLAVLTADPIIIPDSLIVFAKHIDEKMATWLVFFCWFLTSSSLSR